MALQHIILTRLNSQESTGYDITKHFRQSRGVDWVAGHQQVYRELAKLEARDAVSHTVYPQDRKPDRKVYKITAKGLEELGDWVKRGQICLHPFRDEISAKILAAQPDDLPHVIQSLENLKDKVEANLKQIQQTNTKWLADKTANSHEIMMKKIVLNRTKAHWESLHDWCNETIFALRAVLIEPNEKPQQHSECNSLSESYFEGTR
ncbi:transcriptional regulator [Photobacterium rosenbergii]|uniref:Transcriptional regulator n=1 Tax=Photobacterium rosenbergii TaxID=294936 RepID=A0A2T3N691_9GAMM|nr:helix-turn-helix transcriptional regulator [Photobacterium rosenbergii]PSW08244.1 transcriptional regulator [Photobacterium rosenbergii]